MQGNTKWFNTDESFIDNNLVTVFLFYFSKAQGVVFKTPQEKRDVIFEAINSNCDSLDVKVNPISKKTSH